MGIGKSFTMAISSIINNKVRSLLTMLGIIIGIASVIILVSVMNGLTTEVTSTFSEFGTSALTVTIRPRSTKQIEPEQMYEFVEKNSEFFDYVSPRVSLTAEVKTPESADDTISSSCSGVTEDYRQIQSLEMSFGNFISYTDCQNSSRSAVIGSYQATYFFGSSSAALGKKIRLNGLPFTVIGVLEEKEDSTQGSGDDVIYIPYSTAQDMTGTTVISNYSVNTIDDDKVSTAKKILEAFLFKEIGDDDYYTVTSLQEMIDKMTEMLDKMELVLVAIAGISLLVGGIGIMNIMLVSVSERTREIGIRKSLGAKHKHIMTQFVMESGVVSCIGGIIGIILGISASYLSGKGLGMEVVPSTGAIGIAFFVSVGIGIVFGFLPARKAAMLNPIDALRND